MPKSYGKTGLYAYKVNRPLSDAEIRDHLPQKEPSLSAPWFQLSVIRMNSTFLECVDRLYAWRGFGTAMALGFSFIPIMIMTAPLSIIGRYSTITPEKQTEMAIGGFVLFLIGLACLAFLFWMSRFECFRHTHYPTRFNRKTRMVHVFRPNGKVLSVPWDKIYFTLGFQVMDYWEVVGHILSKDGSTVLDTFPLSMRDIRNDRNPKTTLYQHWEFVRRYMEEGPENLYNQVGIILPIDKKKETFLIGCKRVFANYGEVPIAAIFVSPVILCCVIGRWIAMRTCKIPLWPDEVEAESQIDPDDPYIRDEHHLASWADMEKNRSA